MTTYRDWAALIGRILLGLMFVTSGWDKISGFAGTAGYIASAGLPMPQVLAVVAILIEFVGGIMLIVGWQARWAGLALSVFTLVAALGFHRYWDAPPANQMAESLNFWKNISIAGGMLMVFALGPGRISFDKG
ncbi:MAG: DoxX family protein [Betaproteobacteria bacterium]